jgi:TatD DNase family protein
LDEFGGVSRIEAGAARGGGSGVPPLVVHCFTGEKEEALEYISRGFYIGLTGTICKHQRGEKLREIISSEDVPLNRIMLETDAPYMGFVKGRRNSEPSDVALVAEMVASLKGVDVQEVRRVTSMTTQTFFQLN